MSDLRPAFNLIGQPWLPCRRRSGTVEHIPPWRITDRIAEDPFVAFAWPRPDFNGAAHELLIGLLSTAVAPEDDEAWEDWWDDPPAPDVLRSRITAVAHAFDLNGPGPGFYKTLICWMTPRAKRWRHSSSTHRAPRNCATTRICS